MEASKQQLQVKYRDRNTANKGINQTLTPDDKIVLVEVRCNLIFAKFKI